MKRVAIVLVIGVVIGYLMALSMRHYERRNINVCGFNGCDVMTISDDVYCDTCQPSADEFVRQLVYELLYNE